MVLKRHNSETGVRVIKDCVTRSCDLQGLMNNMIPVNMSLNNLMGFIFRFLNRHAVYSSAPLDNGG